MSSNAISVECHPLEPFLPAGATILMLGSFPPKRERWSMHFFYPNWINDMWRIMGLIFYNDRHYFEVNGTKSFDQLRIEAFCESKGIALYDTAKVVRRLNDNASDKFLEVVEPTNVDALMRLLPQCHTIVTTGEKATETLCAQWHVDSPRVGSSVDVICAGRNVRLYRMPSTSRAYPLAIEKKAQMYRMLFIDAI